MEELEEHLESVDFVHFNGGDDEEESDSEYGLTSRPWFLILMLLLPWLWLTLEELTAPFIRYTPEMLIYMYAAESTVRFYYADDLGWWLTAIIFDALYKYVLYLIYQAPADSDAFQLGG